MTEPAIDIFKKNKEPDFKDGDGGDEYDDPDQVNIKIVDNGYIITTIYTSGDEIVEVFDIEGSDNGELQALKCISESMGIENFIKE